MYGGTRTPPLASARASRTAPSAGSCVSSTHFAAWRHFGHAALDFGREPLAAFQDTAGEQDRKLFAAHLEPRDHRRGRPRQLVGGFDHDLGGHQIAIGTRAVDERRERGDRATALRLVINLRHQRLRSRQLKMIEDQLGQLGSRAAAIGVARHGFQRASADPIP